MPKNKIATISATAMPLRRADEDASETASAEVPEPLLATTDCGAMGASTGRLMVDAAVGAEAWAGIAALGVADCVDAKVDVSAADTPASVVPHCTQNFAPGCVW